MIYDIAFLIFSLFYLPALIFKGKLHKDFGERFGRFDGGKHAILASARDAIWIQAVSVGEVAVLRKLVPALKERYPGRDVVISTVTKTGNDLAKSLYAAQATIFYFPLDLSFIVERVIGLIRPKLYIMIETEIWPNVLRELSRRALPCVVVNGRISDRAFGRYRMVVPILKATLSRIGLYCMRSDEDAGRIRALGADPRRVLVTGNMKFDAVAEREGVPSAEAFARLGLDADSRLYVAGSTHRGEEELVLEAFARLTAELPGLRLLIAPRHVERAREVAELVKKSGFVPVMVSQLRSTILHVKQADDVRSTCLPAGRRYDVRSTPVLILDTIGQLADIYALATVVFIGGSLVNHGGQNPIEPAALGKPILFGPNMFNFKDIAALLVMRYAAVEVGSAEELYRQSQLLLTNTDARESFGDNARQVVIENRGATERCLGEIEKLLNAG